MIIPEHGVFHRQQIYLYVLTILYPAWRAERHEVHFIYTDFSKAFECVELRLLIAKLRGYEIGEPLHTWLSSYLMGLTQQIIPHHIWCTADLSLV